MHRPDPHAGTVEAFLHLPHPRELFLIGDTPVTLVNGNFNPLDTVGQGLAQLLNRGDGAPQGGGGPDLGTLNRGRNYRRKLKGDEKDQASHHFNELVPWVLHPRIGQPSVARLQPISYAATEPLRP